MPSASPKQLSKGLAKAKKVALAKAQKALLNFTGDLSLPIVVPDPNAEWGPLSFESLEPEIANKRRAKLGLLLAHYRIPPTDKDRWFKLVERLTVDVIPGMITVEQRSSPYKKWSHKDKTWTFDRYAEFVRAVNAHRGANGKGKIIAAIVELVKQRPEEWGTYKGREGSLVPRYHEGRKVLASHASLGLLSGQTLD
jgi:hypothetical protein